MLGLNIAKIRTAEEHVERVYPPEALGPDGDAYKVVAPVSLVFDLHKDKDRFHLVGRVTTTLEMVCGRCLEPFIISVDGPFDLRYQPHAPNAMVGERQIDADDMDAAYYENDEIDIGQLIQEQIYLALPMKPLCTDDCKGLCPACGTNLNRATCDCKTQWEDPRLAALKALTKES